MFRFLFLLFICSVALWSCNDDPIVEPDPEPIVNCRFIERQDPAGATISSVAYYSDGNVRMLVDGNGVSTYPASFWSNVGGAKGEQRNSFGLVGELSYSLDGAGRIIQRVNLDSISQQENVVDFTYNAEGKLESLLRSKQNQGSTFKQQLSRETFTYNNGNVLRQQIFTISHSQGSTPRSTLQTSKTFSYDDNRNPFEGLFWNGPRIEAQNKNNVTVITEVGAGGTTSAAISYDYNEHNFPTSIYNVLGELVAVNVYDICE